MPLLVHLPQLLQGTVYLQGDMPPADLDFTDSSHSLEAHDPVRYDLTVTRKNRNLWVEGTLATTVSCECVRCLNPFQLTIELDAWEALIPLEGPEQASVENEAVDLTPYIRDDILLAFPQYPTCGGDDCVLPASQAKSSDDGRNGDQESGAQSSSSPWSALDKLDL